MAAEVHRKRYLENHLIGHSKGAVQFACQSVDLLLQMLGVHQDLEEDAGQSACVHFSAGLTHLCYLLLLLLDVANDFEDPLSVC